MPDQLRSDAILSQLDAVANPTEIRNSSIPQGMATEWLLEDDGFFACPDYNRVVQRWALAVVYYSTGGDLWFNCSASEAAVDPCGEAGSFFNETRFLDPVQECAWAGISCIDDCVTEIEFEENNLVGTIPTEIALLTDLQVWGMERGGLTGTIPTEIQVLSDLYFLVREENTISFIGRRDSGNTTHITCVRVSLIYSGLGLQRAYGNSDIRAIEFVFLENSWYVLLFVMRDEAKSIKRTSSDRFFFLL